jgi:DeoR family fructose operon transcriptional repressor
MSKSLIPAQRQELILNYLTTHKIVRMDELYPFLDISEATLRRDLKRLEEDGVIELTHGGAIFNQRMTVETEYLQRAQRKTEEKRQIGQLAASLIDEGDVVFINSGTTSSQVIRHIRSSSSITIFSNNVSAALEMSYSTTRYYLIGGEFQPNSISVAGMFAFDNLNQVYADKSIIGVDGISLAHGCTVPTDSEAEVVRLMLERTKGKIIIVADSSKWGVVANYQIATINDINLLVTDENIDPLTVEALKSHSVDCLIAFPTE